jgi:hypothetical protein
VALHACVGLCSVFVYCFQILQPSSKSIPAGEVNIMVSSEAIRRYVTSEIEAVSLNNSRINNFIEQNPSTYTNLSEVPICNAFSIFK